MTQDIILQDNIPENESHEQRRKRLAHEMRYIIELFNSKLAELNDNDVKVEFNLENDTLIDMDAIILDAQIAYFPKPKRY